MKRILLAFLERPLLVIAISLVIAGGVGTYVHYRVNRAPALQYVKATAGTIAVGGDTGTNEAHLTLGFLSGGKIQTVAAKVGATVHAGDTLATLDPGNTAGALTEAKAALAAATASYQKLLNGATGPTIDATKTAVNTATVNLKQVTAAQDLLVQHAYSALLNVSPTAYSNDPSNIEDTPPTISGSYTLDRAGTIYVHTYSSGSLSGLSFDTTGLATTTKSAMATTPQPIGNTGLFIQFGNNAKPNRTWLITLPNTQADGYVAALNAYQSAKQTHDQAIAAAQAALDQANANLSVVVAKARPEDVAAAEAQVEQAKGAVQVAQAAYNNTLITAPTDGTISAVRITPGQLAVPNTPAIEMAQNVAEKSVSVMVPNSALITRGGNTYVEVMTDHSPTTTAVTTGVHDATHTEITSGVQAGQMVALQD